LALDPCGGEGVKTVSERLRQFGHNLGLSVENRPGKVIFVFLLVYALTTYAHAKRHFWYDELFTYYLCRLPHFSDIWAAIMDGLDFNPPILYLTTRLSNQVFGVSPESTRLPQMAGFFVMCLSLFVFVRRRCGNAFGLAAMWFPLLTGAYSYASEARAYGIVMGFCGLAAVFWQAATRGGQRRAALLGLVLSISGLILTHCYAVLILIAFGIAELTRLSVRRKTDWPVWLSIVTPLAFALVYIPMLQHVKSYAIDSIAFKSGLLLAPRFYGFLFNDAGRDWERSLLHETIWPLLIVLVATALCARKPEPSKELEVRSRGFAIHEVGFLVALALLPLFGQLLAQAMKTPFVDRYALSAVFGVSALLAALTCHVTGGKKYLAAGMVLFFAGVYVADFGMWFASLGQERPWDLPMAQLSTPTDIPIVISDPLMFLEADFYERPELASRLRFITDREPALRYTGTDMFDRGYYTMRRWFPIKGQVVEYSDFLSSTKHFFVLGPFFHPEDWLLRRLTTIDGKIEMKGQFRYPATHGSENVLLEITLAH
jgi:hypothetical protein